jgi:hypothetical protein
LRLELSFPLSPFDLSRVGISPSRSLRLHGRHWFNDCRFNHCWFNDRGLNDCRFNDRRLNDRRFNDRRLNDRRFNDRRLNDGRFDRRRCNRGRLFHPGLRRLIARDQGRFVNRPQRGKLSRCRREPLISLSNRLNRGSV